MPPEAVIQTGKRSVVIVAQADGRFAPVEVQTGTEANGKTEIRKGLEAGQKVVVSGPVPDRFGGEPEGGRGAHGRRACRGARGARRRKASKAHRQVVAVDAVQAAMSSSIAPMP